ncbi:unnamed protein product [Scytosiphon promiscuus]
MAAPKATRAPRLIRESTFLDDPSLYPEYEDLVAKLPAWHRLRKGFHDNRTAVLLLLLAICMAISGVPVPPLDGTASAQEWLDFAFHSMAIDRLVYHFEGIATGFAAIIGVAFITVLAYPLHAVVTRAVTPTNGKSMPAPTPSAPTTRGRIGGARSFLVYAVAAGLPSVAIWAFAVWAERQCSWALAPGLWLGLFCACVTLKITAFVASSLAAAPAGSGGGAASGDVDSAEHLLTFREYLFYVFLSPSLICEIHLMKTSARRQSRPFRAASEFFHALLGFLCGHCVVGSMLAPSLRLFFSGLLNCQHGCWLLEEGAGASWAELEAAGGAAGWPSWAAGSSLLAGGAEAHKGLGPLVTVACFLWMLVVVSSAVHFLVFYAFWHCVCLGIAELWGFPDRHLYGCWWLLFDEPRDFMRMWSTPVHRWLSAYVHLPTMELARRWSGSSGRSKGSTVTTWLPAVVATCVVSGVYHEAVVYVAMRGTCWPFNTFLLCVAGVLIITWDVLFPARSNAGASPSPDGGSGADAASSDTGGGGGKVKKVRVYGERGMLSAVMFTILVQLSAFIADGAAWLWWRHLHVKN